MTDLTYPEVGASRGEPLPAGYQHIQRQVNVGVGRDVYKRVADGMMRWQIHDLAGLRPGRMWFEVRAFSRPVSWYARFGGPVTTWLQQAVTSRYLAAAGTLAAGPVA